MELTVEDKRFLLKVARDILYNKLTDSEYPVYYKSKDIYKEKIGIFIKVILNDNLRAYGSILEPKKGLIETIQAVALNACFDDTRFLPLKAEELENISIQLAVVDTFEEIHDRKLIKPNIHGLYIESGAKRGAILPWDIEKFQMDNEQYIKELVLKAGIDDSTKTKLKIIKVITFGEKDF